jgi:hypothetical protein
VGNGRNFWIMQNIQKVVQQRSVILSAEDLYQSAQMMSQFLASLVPVSPSLECVAGLAPVRSIANG